MMIRVLSLVFLFIIRLRFPSHKSVSNVVRDRYGNAVLVKIRKLEKLDFRVRKLKLDITFLEVCIEKDVMPNFVQFRTANKTLKSSKSYDRCQRILLTEELDAKKLKLTEASDNLKAVKKELWESVSLFDFVFISSLFLEKNRKMVVDIEQKQNSKLSKILEDKPCHKAEDLIYNFSTHVLTPAQKSLLMKGLNFSLPPKSLKSEDYLLNFELLFRGVKTSDNCKAHEFENFKAGLRDLAYSSLRFYNRKSNKLENLTEEEYRGLLELTSLDNLVIQKADKGNVIVLVDKGIYTKKIENILRDTSKFESIEFDQYGDLKYLLKKQEEITGFLKGLRGDADDGVISSEEYGKMVPKGSCPGILYGLCKVHKETQEDNCPPFRPILSAIGTSSYGLAKFLVPLLAPITTNSYVCKDSFSFAAEVRNQNSDLYMASFDVDSLFTNIPLDETIDICIKKLFGRKHKFGKFSRSEFRKLLQFAVKDALILFNGKYYIQRDGVAMGSPLGPTLANVFLCHWEEVWLNSCPKQFAPVYYRRYIDDTFLLFSSMDDIKKFHKFLNSRHNSMTFTYETEENDKLPFLDVLVSRDNGCFTTSLYRKPTFSGLYTNFHSYISDNYKKGLVYCLLFRVFTLTVCWEKFHVEVLFLRNLFRKNLFPEHVIDKCIKVFLNKKFNCNVRHIVEKQKFIVSLPFLGKYSNDIKRKLLALASKHLKGCVQVQIIWNSTRKIRNSFVFKDRLPMHLRSKILYKYTCDGCNSVYIGKTVRHFLVRAYEHLGVSIRTGRSFTYNPKNLNNTSVLNHLHQSGCRGELANFEIIGGARNDFFLKVKESLLIKKFKPTLLNQSSKSTPLYLFD